MINEAIFKQFPVLESDRLLFREFELGDAKNILAIRSNMDVMAYMDTTIIRTIVAAEGFVNGSGLAHTNKTGICWAIIDKTTNQFIGDFSYHKLDRKNHRGEIGYTLKPECWGKGYMRETMETLFKFGFEELNIHSIEANINPKNGNSRNILLKMGFLKEAYFKESYFFKGQYLDSEIYSLLAEWQTEN
ncbi:MAG: ribosomal-protein-alanine N-acetyltransferase [Flavobacteriaceae bacterium]|jgi:ribosomal-protein-alanine N-acetyltransferase